MTEAFNLQASGHFKPGVFQKRALAATSHRRQYPSSCCGPGYVATPTVDQLCFSKGLSELPKIGAKMARKRLAETLYRGYTLENSESLSPINKRPLNPFRVQHVLPTWTVVIRVMFLGRLQPLIGVATWRYKSSEETTSAMWRFGLFSRGPQLAQPHIAFC